MSEQEAITEVLAGFVPIGDDHPKVTETRAAVVDMLRQRAVESTLESTGSEPGTVIHPGDVLLMSVDAHTTVEAVEKIKKRLEAELPRLARVIVMGGVHVEAVYRETENE